MHLLLKNCGSSEPQLSAKVTEITEGEEAPAETATEEAQGATSEIIPLATRTKEGMAALVKVLKGLPGRPPDSWNSLHLRGMLLKGCRTGLMHRRGSSSAWHIVCPSEHSDLPRAQAYHCQGYTVSACGQPGSAVPRLDQLRLKQL